MTGSLARLSHQWGRWYAVFVRAQTLYSRALCTSSKCPRVREPAGKCAEFFKSSSCKDVEPGDAAVAQCISDLVAAAEAGDSQDAGENSR